MSFVPIPDKDGIRYYDNSSMSKGIPEDKSRCAEEVSDGGRWPTFHQCSKRRGHGPNGEYCKVHDPGATRERKEKKYQEYKKQVNIKITREGIGNMMIAAGYDTTEKVDTLLKSILKP
jgi:hypothetical protein